MWIQCGNSTEAGAVPKTIFERGYMLSVEQGFRKESGMLKTNWHWHISSTKTYDIVFEAQHYWADIRKIGQWMPDTCAALLGFPATLEQVEREEKEIAVKTANEDSETSNE